MPDGNVDLQVWDVVSEYPYLYVVIGLEEGAVAKLACVGVMTDKKHANNYEVVGVPDIGKPLIRPAPTNNVERIGFVHRREDGRLEIVHVDESPAQTISRELQDFLEGDRNALVRQ